MTESLFPDGYTDWTWGELEHFTRQEIERLEAEISRKRSMPDRRDAATQPRDPLNPRIFVADPVDRLDRRLQRLLKEAEEILDHRDLMAFAAKLHARKEAFWEKHVYPEFRKRIEGRRGR